MPWPHLIISFIVLASNTCKHHHWNCNQHICCRWVLCHTLEACSLAHSMVNILRRRYSCGYCKSSMVYYRLLGWRKSLRNYLVSLGIRHHDYLDSCMDCFGRSIWKTKSINWKEPIRVSEALNILSGFVVIYP